MKTCTSCKRTWDDEFRVCPIDGSPLQVMAGSADPSIGKSIGQCRIVEKIGEGDLGPVYKAEDPIRGAIALQVTPPERLSSPILMEAFTDAVKLSSRLNHPHVIRVFGSEAAPDGSVAVLMEYCAGTDLQSYRRANPGMDTNQACALIRQVCEGVLAAHRQSMLHSALHPARILVGPDGTVKVGGFHRSGLREGVDVFTATAENLPYIAPEQLGIVRDTAPPDYRADIYSIGVMLYELLAARLPHEAKTVQELATLLEQSPPLPPNFANPQVSPLLSRVVLKALGKHPSERHGSVEEFLRELDATRQTAREPQRPTVSPQYPPPSADGGLFPSQHAGADSGLFSTPARSRDSEPAGSIWPDRDAEKQGSGEGSFFGWFKTRFDSGSSAPPSRQAPSSRGASWDDQSSTDAPRRRENSEAYSERTVVVSGSGRSRPRRRSFSETVTNFGFRRGDPDGTGTGTLPARKVSTTAWIIAAVVLLLVLVATAAIYVLFFSTPKGKLIVLTTPPGAQVLACPEPCEDADLKPLTGQELPAGLYKVRVVMDGYETREDRVEVIKNDDRQHYYELVSKLPPPPPPPPPVTDTTQVPATAGSTAPAVAKPSLATPFYNALRAQNYFPDSPGNAWDILQRWQQNEAGTPSTALEEAVQRFCRAVEDAGNEKISQKDFAGTRQILDQMRTRMPGQPCGTGLQASYDKAVSNDKANLLISAQSAMSRQNYVTPDSANALKYVRQVQDIDPQDSDARRLDSEIFDRAWEHAHALAVKRQHQAALEIYNQLRVKYPSPPVGMPAIVEAIQKQTQKLEQYQALKPSYTVQVRHGHGRNLAFWKTRECTGTLRVDGFTLDFKSQSPNGHPFTVSYDGLKEVRLSGDTLMLVHPGIRPEGRIELQEIEKKDMTPTQLYKKILEYKDLYAQYMK